MTRDFKIGLITGVVLAFIALIWVVTRPTLSPQARMTAPPTKPSPQTPGPGAKSAEPKPTPSEPESETPSPAEAKTPTPSKPVEHPAFEPEIVEPTQTAQADLTDTEKTQETTPKRYHVVQKDETLSYISQLYYGTPNQWRKIVKANPDTIKDANRISPGIKIVIPE